MSRIFNHIARSDYSQNPLLVYWETTRACMLSCRHCRASAMPDADPNQLSYEEGISLLDSIASFGDPLPHLVMTGGDPLNRSDLIPLIKHAASLGIGVSVTPAATPKLTKETLQELMDAGVDSIALSIDGSTPALHDGIRQVEGCFENTVRAARWAGELGLPLQINTLISEETVHDFDALYELMKTLPIMRWSLFFLISVGRGALLNELESHEGETLMRKIQTLAAETPFQIKTTEAPSYRRIVHEVMSESGMTHDQLNASGVKRGYGIRDGHGIVFVSHIGEVYPSGFLPLIAGNVRERPLPELYRDSEVFHIVRDIDSFEGKCGYCEYRRMCGGSRARAFAHTGNAAGSDPFCPYEPKRALELAS